jgi:hypothetical protein
MHDRIFLVSVEIDNVVIPVKCIYVERVTFFKA